MERVDSRMFCVTFMEDLFLTYHFLKHNKTDCSVDMRSHRTYRSHRHLYHEFGLSECMANVVAYISNMLKGLFRMENHTEEEDFGEDLYRRCREEYIPNIILESAGNVEVWWLPKEFSQSKMSSGSSGSNACTLIAVLVALKSHGKEIALSRSARYKGYEKLLFIFCSSIVEGNKIHEELQRSGNLSEVNLTVPEAIRACDALGRLIEWKSLIYMMEMKESLFKEMSEKLVEFYDDSVSDKVSELFITLITENRTVLFIIQRDVNMVTLVDSHQHIPYGAVAAQTKLQHLEELCLWYDDVLRHHYRLVPECYELSYLYVESEPCWLD